MKFNDDKLLNKYLKVTKDILVKSLKSQICKDFEWVLLIEPKHLNYLKSEIGYDFTPIFSPTEFNNHMVSNSVNIQTRHDCDDWMSPKYVKAIQDSYNDNIAKYDKFLIQSQPIKKLYPSGTEMKLKLYTSKRCSMHLSLCQKEVDRSINERIHSKMYEVTPNVISLGEGYTKWIIHGSNISVIGRRNNK